MMPRVDGKRFPLTLAFLVGRRMWDFGDVKTSSDLLADALGCVVKGSSTGSILAFASLNTTGHKQVAADLRGSAESTRTLAIGLAEWCGVDWRGL